MVALRRSFLVVAFATLLLSCTQEKAPAHGGQPRKTTAAPSALRVAYLPIASDASFFVALERGYFRSSGLAVQPVRFETSNQALEALVAGRVDATAPVGLETLLSIEAASPGKFRIVEMAAATRDTRVHRIEVRRDAPYASLADLRGKRIGVQPGSQMPVFTRLILGRHFDAATVDVIQLKPALQPQALQAGQVDALFTLEPVGTIVEANGIGKPIAINPLFEYILQPFPTAASVISTAYLQRHPAVAAAFDAALTRAHADLRGGRVDVASVLPKYAPVDPALAPRVGLYDYWNGAAIDRAAVQKLADLYAQHGIVERKINTATLYARASP